MKPFLALSFAVGASVANPGAAGSCSDIPPPPEYPWIGSFTYRSVELPSRASGASLCATVFLPAPASGPYPAVVLVPGGNAGERPSYSWIAAALATHGYVSLIVEPQGQGESEAVGDPLCQLAIFGAPFDAHGYPHWCLGLLPFTAIDRKVDAVVSAIDFLEAGSDSKITSRVDATRIGAAGHSQGARAVSYAQGIDPRIVAIVAFDNLASDAAGDRGSRGGGRTYGLQHGWPRAVTPRAPAMGQAADDPGLTDPERFDDPTRRREGELLPQSPPETKKTAYAFWRSAGVETMQLVFRGAAHGSWTSEGSSLLAGEDDDLQKRRSAYYTLAWFDRWLRGDATATARLLAPVVDGEALGNLLSVDYFSAAFLDGTDCEDLTACTGENP